MKEVSVEFVNMQSHEHTKFTLKPGLNFILADDNNVGKSTIFKVLCAAAKLPRVQGDTLEELLRYGCTQARATFRFDGTVITMWIFKEAGKSATAFFEITGADGQTVRHARCPKELLEALDIVLDDDGEVLNFNKADCVQLVVEDNPQNDRVLSKILIDLDIEQVKGNMIRLEKEMLQDEKELTARVQDMRNLVSSLSYNDSVDNFEVEENLIIAGCKLMDSGISELTFDSKGAPMTYAELAQLQSAAVVLGSLESLEFTEVNTTRIDTRELRAASNVLSNLLGLTINSKSEAQQKIEESIPLFRRGLATASIMEQVLQSASSASWATTKLGELTERRDALLAEIKGKYKTVVCPIKGEVYFDETICIPNRD